MASIAPVSRAGGTLLSAAAATGSAIQISDGVFQWTTYGTWDGATATLQWSPNATTTWIDVDGSLTANGAFTEIYLSAGHVRTAISGAGGTTSLTSKLGAVGFGE